jgi:Domain of unknown function (DUF5658)
MSTVVFVDRGLDEALPASLPGAELVAERRAALATWPGPERRRRKAPRLEPRENGLAVVHTCPDCGRVSIVPFVPGAGLAAAPPCPCAAAAPFAAATLTPGAATLAPGAATLPRPSVARERSVVVGVALALLWLLNIDDVLLTRRALAMGAVEANTVMAQFLRLGFTQAALIKMAVVTGGAIFLWTQRRRRVVLAASVALAAVYLALVIYQVVILSV